MPVIVVGVIAILIVVVIAIVAPVSSSSLIKFLVPSDDNTKIALHPEALSFLRSDSMASLGKLGIVTFIGRARSGKSFTLDFLLNTSEFAVGHTMMPKTQGAELWAEPQGNSNTIIYVDTEGLGAAPAAYDKAMLLFCVLISSHVVYHLSDYIYLEDVTRLYSIVNLVNLYKSRNLRMADLPALTWVVQKSTLLSPSASSSPLSLLFGHFLAERPNPKNSVSIAEFNETAKVVATEFKCHHAFFIPPAIENASLFTHLSEFGDRRAVLDPRYVKMMDQLRDLIHTSTVPRRTGAELADFAASIIPVVNEGGALIADTVIDEVGRRAIRRCLEFYDQSVRDLPMPLDDENLSACHIRFMAQALERFDTEMIGDKAGYRRDIFRSELAREISKILHQLVEPSNLLALARQCNEVSDDVTAALGRIGSLADFDKAIPAVMANATSHLHGPAIQKQDCVDRLEHTLISNLRGKFFAASIPARLYSIMRCTAIVLAFAVIVNWIFVSNRVTKAVITVSVSILLVAILAFDERYSIVQARTIVEIMDSITNSYFVLTRLSLASVIVAALSWLSWKYMLILPDPETLALQLRHRHISRFGSLIIDPCPFPPLSYLERVGTQLGPCLQQNQLPIMLFGRGHYLNLRLMPRNGVAHVCMICRTTANGKGPDNNADMVWVDETMKKISLTPFTSSDRTTVRKPESSWMLVLYGNVPLRRDGKYMKNFEIKQS